MVYRLTASAGKGDKNQGEGGGGGRLPMMAYTWRFRPKGVPFFTLEVNGMVGIYSLKYIEDYRNLSFGSVKGPKRANR